MLRSEGFKKIYIYFAMILDILFCFIFQILFYFIFLLYKFLFIYLAMSGLHCGTWDFFSCGTETLSCSMRNLVP